MQVVFGCHVSLVSFTWEQFSASFVFDDIDIFEGYKPVIL